MEFLIQWVGHRWGWGIDKIKITIIMMKKINKYILNAYAGLMCIPFMLIFLMEFTLEIHCPIL